MLTGHTLYILPLVPHVLFTWPFYSESSFLLAFSTFFSLKFSDYNLLTIVKWGYCTCSWYTTTKHVGMEKATWGITAHMSFSPKDLSQFMYIGTYAIKVEHCKNYWNPICALPGHEPEVYEFGVCLLLTCSLRCHIFQLKIVIASI